MGGQAPNGKGTFALIEAAAAALLFPVAPQRSLLSCPSCSLASPLVCVLNLFPSLLLCASVTCQHNHTHCSTLCLCCFAPLAVWLSRWSAKLALGCAVVRLCSLPSSQQSVAQLLVSASMPLLQFGFPAGVLNLFWGVLIWKRKAEEALEASGMSYTIIRPGITCSTLFEIGYF